MGVPDFTVVLGVDAKHLKQLSWTYATWRRRKPSLLNHPLLIFYDHEQVKPDDIYRVVEHDNLRLKPWPLIDPRYYKSTDSDKFSSTQRYKMLSGFVHVPARWVDTPYFLKLDTDTIAADMDDWIEPSWFDNEPAIVSHPWGFTRPADQLDKLNHWVNIHTDALPKLWKTEPLNLSPQPEADRVSHPRIISWCAFVNTAFNRLCADYATITTPLPYHLPIPSQDTYLWYMAARMGMPIVRTSMKRRGWEVWMTDHNIRSAVERVLYNIERT